MEKTIIYVLENNNVPFYIGKAKDVDARFYHHKKTYGKHITYKILDEIPSWNKNDWKPYECAWIQIYKEWGYELVNKNEGGAGMVAWKTKEHDKNFHKQYYLNNKQNWEKWKSNNKQWYIDNPDKVKEFGKWNEYRKQYQSTPEQMEKRRQYNKQRYLKSKQQQL